MYTFVKSKNDKMRFNLLLLFTLTFQFVFSQTAENTVTLTTSGTGKTLEEAKNNALRSAIEQAFGAFISSKTEILNDQLVSDQITSVSSGNIQKFEIKSESKLPNDIWCTTLTATVSVDKLISFVQAKGVAVEIKGGLFALNVKQQILNEKAEIENIIQLVGNVHAPFQGAFNFEIIAESPVSADSNNERWNVPLQVNITSNENFYSLASYFSNTLSKISLTEDEVKNYRSLNKMVYPIKVKVAGNSNIIYLRKLESIYILQSFCQHLNKFERQFSVNWGGSNSFIGESFQSEEKIKLCEVARTYVPTNGSYDTGENFYIVLNFPNSNTILNVSKGNHGLSLSELEQISEYKVNPLPVQSRFGFGGYIVYETIVYDLGVKLKNSNFTIDSIIPGRVGEINGLLKGDKILKVNQIPLEKPDLNDLITKSSFPNKNTTIEIERNGQIFQIDIIPERVKKTLVTAPLLYGPINPKELDDLMKNFNQSGFHDWKLPTSAQMQYIFQTMNLKGRGSLVDKKRIYGQEYQFFWCLSDEKTDPSTSKALEIHNFTNYGVVEYEYKDTFIQKDWDFKYLVLPIRVNEIILNE